MGATAPDSRPTTDPIARRVLTRADGAPVTVEIDRPAPFDPDDAETDWYCPYRITGAGAESTASHASGVDAVQALKSAFTKISAYLAYLNRATGDRGSLGLSFHGLDDLGF